MPKGITLVTISLSVFLFMLVIELVRRRKLKEEFSLLWLFAVVLICAGAIWEKSLFLIARLIGVEYVPSILFLFGLFFLIITNIYYAVKLSSTVENLKNLTQKVSILEAELEQKQRHE